MRSLIMPDPRIDSIAFFVLLGVGILCLIAFATYLLYVAAVWMIYKEFGKKSKLFMLLALCLIVAPPAYLCGKYALSQLQKKRNLERIAKIRKESELNTRQACSLEHKLTVYRKIPKESGILFSIPKGGRTTINWEDHRYGYVSDDLKQYAKPSFLEWQTQQGEYKRRVYKDGAILSEITQSKDILRIEETLSQYHFVAEDITTAIDKKKRIQRLQMTLSNRKSGELMASYISFYSEKSSRSYFEDGCLKVNHSDREARNPFRYFFAQALDENQIQPLPNAEKNPDAVYQFMGYEDVWAFHDDLAVVQRGEKKGFINRQGEIVIPIAFQDVTSFREKRALFREGEHWGIINEQGKVIVPATYDAIRPFDNGLAYAKKQDQWGLINHAGQLVLPTEYQEIEAFKAGFAKVSINRSHGMVNSQGKLILPAIYDAVYDMKYGLIRVRKDQKKGAANGNGDFVIPIKFEGIDMIDVHFTKVKYESYWGVLNTETGEEIVPIVYDTIRFFKDKPNVIEAHENGEKLLFNIEAGIPVLISP